MTALPSASSATTAYAAQSNYNENEYGNSNNYGNDNHGNNNYGNDNYSNNYNSNYGDSGYSSNYASTTSTQYAAGAETVGVVPASYGSPSSIDIDAENEIRRTDSILGGTGVMAGTFSSEQTPFEFSGGPSPDDSHDVWGNEESSSFRQKRTASNVSVEF
ncbi:hypothetical protein ON010_g3649 [Phytophthora cinnamomi]|nr:hypothetical protein ON010_g3649 [Phytophthora cinnamomi]